MEYIIDLKLPKACKECGYKCCAKHYKECPRPIFGGEFCYRNRIPACKSYPLFVKGGKLVIEKCLGHEHIPWELYQLVEQINKEGLHELAYKSDEVELTIKKLQKAIKVNIDMNLAKLLS